jgi:hypothetical protein
MRTWIYTAEGEESVTIGYEVRPRSRDPRVHAVVLEMIYTDDREEAEGWRQALAKGEIPDHDPVASRRAELRWAHRELGMSREALAQRFRREPEMAQLVEAMWSELEVVDPCGCGLASGKCQCAHTAPLETQMDPSSAGSAEQL